MVWSCCTPETSFAHRNVPINRNADLCTPVGEGEEVEREMVRYTETEMSMACEEIVGNSEARMCGLGSSVCGRTSWTGGDEGHCSQGQRNGSSEQSCPSKTVTE